MTIINGVTAEGVEGVAPSVWRVCIKRRCNPIRSDQSEASITFSDPIRCESLQNPIQYDPYFAKSDPTLLEKIGTFYVATSKCRMSPENQMAEHDDSRLVKMEELSIYVIDTALKSCLFTKMRQWASYFVKLSSIFHTIVVPSSRKDLLMLSYRFFSDHGLVNSYWCNVKLCHLYVNMDTLR